MNAAGIEAALAMDAALTAHTAEVRKFILEGPMTQLAKASQEFEDEIDKIRQRDSTTFKPVSRYAAMQTLSATKPHLVAAYNKAAADARSAEADLPPITKSAGQILFESRVAEIQKRDSSSRHAAMSKAAVEFPAEFEAFQAG